MEGSGKFRGIKVGDPGSEVEGPGKSREFNLGIPILTQGARGIQFGDPNFETGGPGNSIWGSPGGTFQNGDWGMGTGSV